MAALLKISFNLFYLMVVVPIQTTELLRFLGSLQLSTHKAELRTVVGLNAQPAVHPRTNALTKVALVAARIRQSPMTGNKQPETGL